MFEIIFLGTAGMVPTKDRNHTSVLLKHDVESMLFDCGEGVQRQFKIAKEDIMRLTKIFITHWHGDHVLGLPGLLQSLNINKYNKHLDIYGPKGTKKYFSHMFNAFSFDNKLDMEIHEVEKDGLVCERENYLVEARTLRHSTLCLGYRFSEKPRRRMNMDYIKKQGIPEGPLLGKLQAGETITYKGKRITPDKATYIVEGKKVAYISDTEPCPNAVKLASDVDILIADSMHLSDIEDKAEEFQHLTSKQAAQIASQSNAKKLILTHFSQRYKTTADLEREAKDIFPNTIAAFDFMKVKVR